MKGEAVVDEGNDCRDVVGRGDEVNVLASVVPVSQTLISPNAQKTKS